MKYFLLETMKNFTDAPQVRDWYKTIEVRNLTPERFSLLPKRTLFFVTPNPNLVFVDILSTPFFMVTKEFIKVLKLYEPDLPTRQAVLLDPESGLSEVYYIPSLKVLNCLSPASVLNMDKSVIKKAVLDYETVKNLTIFKIGDVKNSYIVVRMDAAESILKRTPRGAALVELETD